MTVLSYFLCFYLFHYGNCTNESRVDSHRPHKSTTLDEAYNHGQINARTKWEERILERDEGTLPTEFVAKLLKKVLILDEIPLLNHVHCTLWP